MSAPGAAPDTAVDAATSPLQTLIDFVPFVAVLMLGSGLLALAYVLLQRREASAIGQRFQKQLVMLALTFVVLLTALAVLPVPESVRTRLFGLLGLLLSGVVAISATTFVGNALAGFMLRAVGNFRPGDFVRVGEHFGRVSDRGFLHTEIQTEDRDLTTLPNLFLVTNPVTVMRSSGTVVSAVVSLGYDVPHGRVEEILLRAVAAAELEDPFVHVVELGDSSVQYRAAGFLRDVKHLLSARSRLRGAMLDELHEAGVEIVSPTFMNQRRIEPGRRFIPQADEEVRRRRERPPEEIIFDKAEKAESAERRVVEIEELGRLRAELARERDAATDATARATLEARLRWIDSSLERLQRAKSDGG